MTVNFCVRGLVAAYNPETGELNFCCEQLTLVTWEYEDDLLKFSHWLEEIYYHMKGLSNNLPETIELY